MKTFTMEWYNGEEVKTKKFKAKDVEEAKKKVKDIAPVNPFLCPHPFDVYTDDKKVFDEQNILRETKIEGEKR